MVNKFNELAFEIAMNNLQKTANFINVHEYFLESFFALKKILWIGKI